MKKFLIFSCAVLVVLLAGCTGLTQLTTYWGKDAGSSDIKPTGYHTDTQTGWMSYNDSTHLYFAFSFFNPVVQSLVLRNGMTVFIDPSKKMKEDCFVRFPLIKREIIAGVTESHQLAQQRGRQGRNQRTSTQMLLEQAQSFELQWQNKDVVMQINPSIEKTDFRTLIAVDTSNVLNVIVGVPIYLINPDGLSALDDIVVGLRFGQAASEQSGGGVAQGPGNQQISGDNLGTGAASGASGGRMSGGRGGGRGGGGGVGGGGGMTGGTAKDQAMANMPQGGGIGLATTEFWYKTTLAKK